VNHKATIMWTDLIQASDVAHTLCSTGIFTKWNERLLKKCTRPT
jgi:hypothetical protein